MNFEKKENTVSSRLNNYFNSYDPKDHGTKYYKSSDFEKYINIMKDRFKKNKPDPAFEAYRTLIKTSNNSPQGYRPNDYGTSYYQKSEFEKYSKMTPLEKIEDIRKRLQSPYANTPSMLEVEKVLTHAIAEITNLQKRKSELEQRVDELLKENDEISNSLAQEFWDTKDNIDIHFNHEVVTIDGELATQVVNQAITQFIIEALNQAANKD